MRRLLVILAAVSTTAALAGCGHGGNKPVDPRPPSTTAVTVAPTTTVKPRPKTTTTTVKQPSAADVLLVKQAQVLIALAKQQQQQNGPTYAYAPVSPPPSIADVMACIRAHESGDYTEHAHPNGSSGAYQYEPDTWITWSARAGYPGYARAYMAPPWVQDAVTAYTLTHGGAGNWSMRWGNDPCTAGLPGGG